MGVGSACASKWYGEGAGSAATSQMRREEDGPIDTVL
jgi:hypothetical protein